MPTFEFMIRSLHALDRYLILIAGSWTLALMVQQWLRPASAQPRIAPRAFVASLHLQVALGLLLLAALMLQGSSVFHGHNNTAWAHSLGGVIAAALGTVSLWQHRQSRRPWLAALLCGAALLVVAKGPAPLLLALLALSASLQWLVQLRHRQQSS